MYQSHTSCIASMSFNNAVSNKLEDFQYNKTHKYFNKTELLTKNLDPQIPLESSQYKRKSKMKNSIIAGELNKMNRLR